MITCFGSWDDLTWLDSDYIFESPIQAYYQPQGC